MGASLSQQEQLFVELRWQSLLENAMEADMADMESTASGEADRRPAQKGFRVSFNELQGFLSVLEYGHEKTPAHEAAHSRTPMATMSPAFSQVCGCLTVDQLHSPVVVMMVHVCSWWTGAITGTTLAERIDALCTLVESKVAKLSGHALPAAPSDDGDSDSEGEAEDHGHGSAGPATPRPGRRARVLQALRRRLSGGNGRGVSDERAMEELQLDTFADLITLFADVVTTSHPEDAKHTTDAATGIASRRANQARRTLFDRLAALITVSERPMVSVALCFLLAVFADRTSEAILYAEDGILQLRQLTTVMTANAVHRDGRSDAHAANGQHGGDNQEESAAEVPSRPSEWGLVQQLEASLMQRQYELDAVQVVSSTGQGIITDMRAIQHSRLQLSAVPLAEMTASERWKYGMSQYVGQRHIWDLLRQHFLSAGLFDNDKPSVLVFFGPSGYGKSEMAKRLASVLHACPVSELEPTGKMVHIHMPSFCTKDSIYSLVDPPAAHVGDGILLSALLKADDAVVVLDEFEKSTADAIQNLWLSAFQKNGTLRSLKKADRCVSTVRTTFVLTCNTSANYIDTRAARYLTTSPEERRVMREDFVSDCRHSFQQSLGDPFVNRVDYFLPFVPYTRDERTQFVEMQLEKLLTHQKDKGRTAYVTPRLVKALVDGLTTFHASTIEEIIRPLVVDMASCGYGTAVFTALTRAAFDNRSDSHTHSSTRAGFTGITFVVLPARRKKGPDGETVEWPAPDDESSRVPILSWQDVKGGMAALALWETLVEAPVAGGRKAAGTPFTAVNEETESASTRAATTASAEPSSDISCGAGAIGVADAPLEVELEMAKEAEKQLTTETEREKALVLEVERLRQTIVEKDKEIVTLKEKIVMLQKALAVMMCMVVCCCFVVAMVVGLKLTLLLVGFMVFLMCVVLGVPLRLLLGAVRALFQFLGPAKAAILILIMAMWVYRAGASLVLQCK